MVGVGFGYCPACGGQARAVCENCDEPLRREWRNCPRCGGEPAGAVTARVAETPRTQEVDDAPFGRAPASKAAAESLNQRGAQAYDVGDYREAARLFGEAVEADPQNASFWVNLGVAQGELGDDLQAANAYRRAIELNPKEIQAYLNIGYLYAERERHTEAREMWERVVQLAPDSDEAQQARENLKSLEDL